MTVALGLMSGTSGDGVSAAITSFKGRSFKLIAYKTFPYPRALTDLIRCASKLRTAEISGLNFRLGYLFANTALKIIRQSKISRAKIACIGSHGQTVYHGPRDRMPSTFQIGEAAVIAEKTGIPVVSDFRPGDIAAGGEGAPLIPFFDDYFYGRGPVRALQNIGGIANVTIVGRDLKKPVAFDTGPGNCLIDLAMHPIGRGRFSHDPSGKYSARGRVQMKWVHSMMRHPYFKIIPPKSTGRGEFGEEFLMRHFARSLRTRPLDVVSTLTYFTALTIFESVSGLAKIKEMIVSGGGVKNLTLMRYLKELFAPIAVRSIEEFGIPAQAKEPIAFAFFALRALQNKVNHLPSVTGARHACILGKITQKGSDPFWRGHAHR